MIKSSFLSFRWRIAETDFDTKSDTKNNNGNGKDSSQDSDVSKREVEIIHLFIT